MWYVTNIVIIDINFNNIITVILLLRFSKDDDRNINRPDNKERHLQPTPVDIKRRPSGRQHRRRRRPSGS